LSASGQIELRRPWLLFSLTGLVATIAYFLVPDQQDVLYLVIGFASAAAIVAGILINRPRQRGWATLAAGVALYCVGDLAYTIIASTTGTEPFPSLADIPYLAGQVLVVVGIARVAAPMERGVYRPALFDAGLVATAGAFLAWPLLLDPMTQAAVDPLSGAVAVSYPLTDLVLVGVMVRHLIRPRKSAAAALLMSGVVAWLVADLVYAGLGVSGEYVTGAPIDAGWLLAYVLVGASALHPSMADIVGESETHESTVSNRRIALIGMSFLVPVAVFLLHGPVVHAADFAGLAVGSVILAILICGRLLGALVASRDLLTKHRALEVELDHRARTDRLTGLANRTALGDRVAALLAGDAPLALLYLDLDDFKRINDAFGHPVGEEVLREVADRLRSIVGNDDDAAHLGGDEYAVLLSPCQTEADALTAARRILDALEPEVGFAGHRFRIGASIGIVWTSGADLTADEVLSRADIAMYQAKGRGGGGYAVFEPEMHERALARTQLQSDLDGAVARGEIEPWFQPIFDVRTEALIGVEALARWSHPLRGMVPPDEFIPIAELSGAIADIDGHIMHVATAFVAEWAELAGRPIALHVNITPREAADESTVERIASAIAKSGLAADSLVVEVTETALIDEAAVAPVLANLKALGVRLSIDDFGSRYAVLTQLGRLPIDIVKIDRSVVRGIETRAGERLFEGIVRLAQSLRLETVAEGVESVDLLPVLRRVGCDQVQGFAFGRPMHARACAQLVLTSLDESAIA
jgi:diguanylate cyclase (GGDEF)-like protein